MSLPSLLTPEEVRAFLQDDPNSNYLLSGEEFTDARIRLAIELAIDAFNIVTPITSYKADTFPSKSILLYGTLHQLYVGQSALLARNTMNYSDGGISLPIEERFTLYQSLAAQYGQMFSDLTTKWKVQNNMESGWGQVGSDYANFPYW